MYNNEKDMKGIRRDMEIYAFSRWKSFRLPRLEYENWILAKQIRLAIEEWEIFAAWQINRANIINRT